MSFDHQKLYQLLPAIYQIRDVEQEGALSEFLGVIAEQIAVLEEDLAQLYDDQFIETCADWVTPYIGDLIGYRTLYGITPTVRSPRAEVANTIAYRRRKGTATMLEQLAQDVTGWGARAVEFFEWLGTSQYMQHIRPQRGGTLNLRDHEACDRIQTNNGAFNQAAHTVDVRRIPTRAGRFNIPNIGIFLWRLQPYSITRSTARWVDWYYIFNPFGLKTPYPLFHDPQRGSDISELAELIDVCSPLQRRILYDELEARRQALVENQPVTKAYFNDENGKLPTFTIFLNGNPVPPEEILICDLSEQRNLPTSKDYRSRSAALDTPPRSLPIRAAIDPVLGRLLVPNESATVEVSYTYGFSSDIGGGTYDRTQSAYVLQGKIGWQMGVLSTPTEDTAHISQTLSAVITAWNDQPAGTVGVIVLMDSHTYQESSYPSIQIKAGSQLLIIAAAWDPVEVPGMSEKQRVIGQFTPKGVRPHIRGALQVQGRSEGNSTNSGELMINGLLLEDSLTVLDGKFGRLQLSHCTLLPPRIGIQANTSNPVEIQANASNPELRIQLDHCICGSIQLPEQIPTLQISNSIVDGTGRAIAQSKEELPAIVASGAETTIQNSTLFGTTTVRTLEASNSIFMAPVTVRQFQKGCVRFSYLSSGSRVPRPYRCQPGLAVPTQINLPKAERAKMEALFTPQFTSTRYGDPTYCQLSQRCAIEIRQGADDEAEMGVFHDLYQPQRETNLRVRLNEYLRFGLEAGIFYVT